MAKGFFFSQDPGGTNAIIPIAKKMTQMGKVEVFNFASAYAIPLWAESGLRFTSLPTSITSKEVDDLLSKINPDFVFTGTSENPALEGILWRAASQRDIITYSIIDHWTRYKERYYLDNVFSPTDVIFTIDEQSRNDMIALGFKSHSVIATGQPHFEKFYSYTPVNIHSRFCADHNLPEKKIILFVSDNISGSFPVTKPDAPLFGFDEHTTLASLLDALDRIPNINDEFQLVIKLHPKEPDDNFAELLRARKISIACHTLKGGNNLETISHCHFVIGMFSMLLFEAFLMGKPVLSVQLNTSKAITFGQTTIPIVVDPEVLPESLVSLMSKQTQQSCVSNTDSVGAIIHTIMGNLERPKKRD